MSTDMSSVNNTNRIEVITGVQRRRRWTPEQKLELVKQTFEAGMTVSLVARQAGIAATHLFSGRKHIQRLSGCGRCQRTCCASI
jgi:transposase